MDGWMDGRVDEWMVEALGSVATWKRCNTITDNTWAFKEIRNELNECRNWAVWFSSKLMADRWAIESDWVDKWMQVRCKRARRATMTNCQLKTSWNELKRAETSWNGDVYTQFHWCCSFAYRSTKRWHHRNVCASISLISSRSYSTGFVSFQWFNRMGLFQLHPTTITLGHSLSRRHLRFYLFIYFVLFFFVFCFLQLSYSAQTNDALSCHIINFRCNEINQSVIMTHALQSRE